MTRRRGNILTLIAVIVLTVMTASVTGCNTTGCTDNRSSLLIAGFYSSTDRRAISIDSLELGGVGAPDDSLLVSANERPSQVYLPLRSRDSETAFCFHYAAKALSDPRLNDTIRLWYTSEPYFASEECGAMYRYRVHRFTYTTHLIDSVAMRDPLINNADIESMMIYFRTQK